MSSTPECTLSSEAPEDREYVQEERCESEYADTVDDTGYLSDSSPFGDTGPKRGRKRKEMCPDEAEVKRVTANQQERQRMMKLNRSLDNLRQCLPDQFKIGNRKMSKIRTLRLASSYIKNLGEMLKHNTVIRDSIPPQPGYEQRLPCLMEVNRQGDGGEIYTPEKEFAFNQFPVGLSAAALPSHRHWYQHQLAHQDSSPTLSDMSYHASVLQYYPVYPTHPFLHHPVGASATVLHQLD